MQTVHEIVLSLFCLEDYDAVFSLWQACEGIGLSEADSRENIARFLARNPGTSVLAWNNATIVGTILAGHDGRRGYLHHLAVHPDYRRRGIGRRLVQKALYALSEQGIGKCHGFVFRTNRDGLGFWQTAGWAIRDDVCLISKSFQQMNPP